ncbi:MAG: hypothetical protein LUC47_08675, partial [Clostridiales bacterium]|nr:hypothetical protein [Clostridiales bacterium]
MCCKDEYLMLREEILHVDTMQNNTLNFMYALIGVVLSFPLTQSDNLYILVIYIVLLPSYAVILGQERTRCKIGTYLLVFHEENGSDFQWERRQVPFHRSATKNDTTIFGHLEAFNFPFLFLSLFATTIFFIKTDWLN